ncbi:MAG: DUF2789 domain-containing protein [Thiotrichales bacterium]|nr:DUF2789 domain-containing protein [Thiotrichales bacterium]
MELDEPTLASLFAQLGLANEPEAIDAFIEMHRGLHQTTLLAEAPFWQPAQRQFLTQALEEDAAWAEVVDQLDAQLRRKDSEDIDA